MPATVAYSHATSFCGAVWEPVVELVGGNALVWDQLGHGQAARISHPFDWWEFGASVGKKVGDVDRPLVGVGHSMGGTALVMAELLTPGMFDYFVLIEPILLPPPFVRRDNHVAQAAKRRRALFESVDEAREHLRQKAPFQTWDQRAFEGYLRDGFRLTGRGDEVTLACNPDDEAEIYRAAFAHGAWEQLGEVEVPTLVMAGERSDTHSEELVREMASRFPSAGVEIIAGVGHFLPMERPDLVADRVSRLQALANS